MSEHIASEVFPSRAEGDRVVRIMTQYRDLSRALAQIEDPGTAELWAASVLTASSVGFDVHSLWFGDLADDLKPPEDLLEGAAGS